MKARTLSDTAVERVIHGELTVNTSGQGLYNVTAPVCEWVDGIGAKSGLLTLFVRHTTAGLTVQENTDPNVGRDLTDSLDRLAPTTLPYRHQDEGEDDMPSHIKASLMGASVSLPVRDRLCCLGTWQAIYLTEHRMLPHSRVILLSFFGSI